MLRGLLEGWAERLRRLHELPPGHVLPERTDEYRGHVLVALAAVEHGLRAMREGGASFEPAIADEVWSTVLPRMKAASRCAFIETAPEAFAPQPSADEPASGVIERASPSEPPREEPGSLRKIFGFLRRGA